MYWIDEWTMGEPAIITEYEEIETSWVDDSDCRDILPEWLGGGVGLFGGMAEKDVAMRYETSVAPTAGASGAPVSGMGGSMARFTIVDDILYTVGDMELHVFNISDLTDPKDQATVYIQWGIETIYPFKENLFIGSTTGMHIFEISNPFSPQYVSTFDHARVCDPVVANDTVAFVTLRSGTRCEGFTNQLDVIDIKDIYNPKLIKSYPMQNPHGLGIDGEALFICEGEYGWKLFNVQDLYAIDQNMVKHFKGINSYDVIPYMDNLMLIGEDGLYQYNYSDLQNVKLLSSLPIVVVN